MREARNEQKKGAAMVPAGASRLRGLFDRLSDALDRGRSLHLSPDDLDVLVLSGAYAQLLRAVARNVEEQSAERSKAQGYAITVSLPDLAAVMSGAPSADGRSARESPPPAANVPEVFTVSSLAEHWGCSTGQVYSIIRAGKLESFRLGTLYRIKRDAVESYQARKSCPVGRGHVTSPPVRNAEVSVERAQAYLRRQAKRQAPPEPR